MLDDAQCWFGHDRRKVGDGGCYILGTRANKGKKEVLIPKFWVWDHTCSNSQCISSVGNISVTLSIKTRKLKAQ
jgi:hypothetical protein